MAAAAPFVVLFAWLVFGIWGPEDKTRVILLEDPDGQVGQVEVVTAGGSQLLSQAGEMTVVRSAEKAPIEVRQADMVAVERTFAAALAIEPLLPEKFLLYFMPDSTELVPESRELLLRILEEINQRNSQDIGINGHSDRVGSEEYNKALSLQRALAVRELLRMQGIDQILMNTASHGEGNPLIETPDNVPEPRNRRVEVIVR